MADRRIGKRLRVSREVNPSDIDYSITNQFSKFLNAKQAEGRSKATISQSKQGFSYFMSYLKEEKGLGKDCDVRSVTTDLVRAYVVHMIDGKVRYADHKFKKDEDRTVGLAPTTINTRLKGLRVFFGWLNAEYVMDVNPMKAVKKVREPEQEIEVLKPDQLKTLFAVPNQRTYAGFRDYVIMNVLLDTMIRINELVNIKVSEFDPQSHTLSIPAENTKGKRFRIVPVSPTTCKLIQELIKESNKDFSSDYVFLANYGERLESGQVRNRLSQYGEEAKIPINVHPHLFRHTGATLFLENGGSERMLQLILGHASLRLISLYTHPSRKAVHAQHAKYSPLLAIQSAQNQPRKTLREIAD